MKVKSRWEAIQAAVPMAGDLRAVSDELLDLVPELIPTRTTPQSPIHHGEGDVWTHTLLVLRELVAGAEYGDASPAGRAVMFVSALLHDIAKPSTTVIDPDGRIRQPGHSKRGAIDARALLWSAGAPFEIRERVCSVIQHHQVPFFGIGDRGGRSGEFTVRKLSWEVRLQDLLAVARADIRGRIAADIPRVLDEIALMELMAMDLGCLTRPFPFPDSTTRFAYFRREGSIPADYPFFEADGPMVTFVCGLPASGKDFWIHHQPPAPVVAYDDMRAAMGVEHGEDEGGVAQATKERVREHLRAGQSFYWNATAIQKTFRDARVDLVRQYGGQVRIVHLEAAGPTLWRSQNQDRAHTVPEDYLQQSLLRWELPMPTEGHEVLYVSQGHRQSYLQAPSEDPQPNHHG